MANIQGKDLVIHMNESVVPNSIVGTIDFGNIKADDLKSLTKDYKISGSVFCFPAFEYAFPDSTVDVDVYPDGNYWFLPHRRMPNSMFSLGKNYKNKDNEFIQEATISAPSSTDLTDYRPLARFLRWFYYNSSILRWILR